MVQEFFVALFKAGLPVGLAGYALVWWAMKQDYLGPASSMKELEKEAKRLAKDKETDSRTDPLHSKWMKFGGGFYGVVGLLTYAVVELAEIRDFFTQFESIGALIAGISIESLIGLFIGALMNFIVAIAWPAYWISDIRSDYIWIWFLAAYAGYWAGTRLALKHANGQGADII